MIIGAACSIFGLDSLPKRARNRWLAATVPTVVLTEGEFSKSNISSSVSANRSRASGADDRRGLPNGSMKRFSISAEA